MSEYDNRDRGLNSNSRNKKKGPIAQYEEYMSGGGGQTDESVLQYTSRSYEELRARDEELFYKEDEGWTFITEEEYQARAKEAENLSPTEEAQINAVLAAGIPTAIAATYAPIIGSKAVWQTFGAVVARQFGQKAAVALGLAVGDGPSPVGDAIAAGLLVVTAWQIVRNWDELWQAANDLLDQQVLESYIPPPKELPAFPDAKKADGKTPIRGGGGYRKRWKEQRGKKRIIEWDGQHGKVEVYNKRGKHLGEFDPETGEQTKPADKSRRVEP